mgnify:CR=1 FL=1
MAKLFSALIILNLIVSACSKTSNKQFEFSGGTITMALDNQPSTYIARDVSDYYSATVLNQICEGLVGIDPKTTKILPKIASEWKRGNDGKSYTFTIRDDVFFHEHAVFESKEDSNSHNRNPHFICYITLTNKELGRCVGNSKKESEQQAAKMALEKLSERVMESFR